MKIYIGADHGGFSFKEALKAHLVKRGFSVVDLGAKALNRDDDYVDFAVMVAKRVAAEEQKKLLQDNALGVLLCRSAAGMVIAANKVKGVRAVSAFDEKTAIHSREHNAANVLALSGDFMDESKAEKVLDAWLSTPFSGKERHVRRIKKISGLEK